MSRGSDMRNSLLVNPQDKPGEYVHENFNDDGITNVQGLVWMPNKVWLLGHVACAAQLVPVGIAQIVVGSIVMKYDSLKGLHLFLFISLTHLSCYTYPTYK